MITTLLSRGNANAVSQVGTNSESVLNLFFAVHIIAGHILLPILVFIFVFRTTRHPALINLCLAAIITSICACLLLYTNTHRGPEPPFDLCLLQASFASGIQPLLVMATFALVFQVWISVYGSKKTQPNPKWEMAKSILLLTLPWIAFAVYVSASASIGLQNPDAVTRNRRFFYCSVKNKNFTRWISIFCAVVFLVIMVMQASIGYNIFRNWRAVRRGESKDVNLSMAIRVICFVASVFIGLILSILAIDSTPNSPIPDLWLASVGLFVVFIFGTQRDVWDALKCCPSRENWRLPKFTLGVRRKEKSQVDLVA